jgi:hypothetical protein
MTIAKAHPGLKLIVQDRDPVVAEGIQVEYLKYIIHGYLLALSVLQRKIPRRINFRPSQFSRYIFRALNIKENG